MTVFENVAFGLRVKPRRERPSEAVIREKVHELLKLVQLDWLADRRPAVHRRGPAAPRGGSRLSTASPGGARSPHKLVSWPGRGVDACR